MFPLGDDLTLELHRLPWLLWLHLFVTFLLLLLLVYFGILAFDVAADRGSPSTATTGQFTSQESHIEKPSKHRNSSNNCARFLQHSQVTAYGVTIKEERPTSRRNTRSRVGEEIQEMDRSSSKQEDTIATVQCSYGPCFFLGLARTAFLKCLGLDTSEDSSTTTTEAQMKADEDASCKIIKETPSRNPRRPRDPR